MAATTNTLRSSRLAQVARRGAVEPQAEAEPERCGLCGEPIAPEHRHVLDLRTRDMQCACRACAILFDRGAAGGGHYRLVPDRRLALEGFALDDVQWAELRIPVDMAFFFHESKAGKVVAYYPSPMGPTESLLSLEAWDAIEGANPILGTLEEDVEALLVDRSRGNRRYLLVPIEDCYSLVGLIRTRWRGLTGGEEVWKEIERFFEALLTAPAAAAGREETTA
jgi:uncharacterized protein DUF5947